MPDYCEIGARLSGADVDRLREAVSRVGTRRGPPDTVIRSRLVHQSTGHDRVISLGVVQI